MSCAVGSGRVRVIYADGGAGPVLHVWGGSGSGKSDLYWNEFSVKCVTIKKDALL